MGSMLVDKVDAIRQACRHINVLRLDIFGSALREDFEPDRSDIDFLVDFGPMPPFDKPNAYFGLLNELRTILGTQGRLKVCPCCTWQGWQDQVWSTGLTASNGPNPFRCS